MENTKNIISFDVGMKNLAYCIFQVNETNSKVKILQWDVINLCTPIVRKCNTLGCTQDAKYCKTFHTTNDEDNGDDDEEGYETGEKGEKGEKGENPENEEDNCENENNRKTNQNSEKGSN